MINVVDPIINLPVGDGYATHKNGDDLGMVYELVLPH